MILTERDREFLGELAKIIIRLGLSLSEWTPMGAGTQPAAQIDDLLNRYTELEAEEMRERFPKL